MTPTPFWNNSIYVIFHKRKANTLGGFKGLKRGFIHCLEFSVGSRNHCRWSTRGSKKEGEEVVVVVWDVWHWDNGKLLAMTMPVVWRPKMNETRCRTKASCGKRDQKTELPRNWYWRAWQFPGVRISENMCRDLGSLQRLAIRKGGRWSKVKGWCLGRFGDGNEKKTGDPLIFRPSGTNSVREKTTTRWVARKSGCWGFH